MYCSWQPARQWLFCLSSLCTLQLPPFLALKCKYTATAWLSVTYICQHSFAANNSSMCAIVIWHEASQAAWAVQHIGKHVCKEKDGRQVHPGFD